MVSNRVLSVAAAILLLCVESLAQTPPRCYGARFDSDSKDVQWSLAIIATELEQDPWIVRQSTLPGRLHVSLDRFAAIHKQAVRNALG
jgi:hypothetical protein